jgi:membrane protein DedA with SNARE-associated domain
MAADILQRFPEGFQLWHPVWQAGALFLSTFVLEDVAALAAGLLLASGTLAWPLAFGSCFLGIWLGDAGLYGLARVIGRNWFECSSLQRLSTSVERSERWFAERGSSILILSRLVPGARLPTYLAAGFLRLPLPRFLVITGAASFVWTGFILLAVQRVGVSVLGWFAPLGNAGWAILLCVVIGFLCLRLARRLLTKQSLQGLRARLIRCGRWEFWPAWVFYPPVAIYCLWLAIKYRGLTLPTAANPGIFSGGIVGESKISTLSALMETSREFTAEAELLVGSTPEERLGALREACRKHGFEYPLILKPDVGQRGVGVKLVRTEDQALAYLKQSRAPLIVQRYIPGSSEVGIFYYRYPHESRGHIFGITEKVFPVIRGNGVSTVAELIRSDPRARLIASTYLKRLKGREHEVLEPNSTLRLVETGNHAQGCIFRDGMHLHTVALEESIDSISRKVPGFFIGRYDIRYEGAEDLRSGRRFKIVELNGAASEATSIYDARNSLLDAYRTLFRQWDIVFAIGAANRAQGARSTSTRELWQTWREYSRNAAAYPMAD